MRYRLRRGGQLASAALLAGALSACATAGPSPARWGPVSAPTSAAGPTVETLHGVQVRDPYRWLEALEGDETRAWITAQNRATDAVLARIPERAAIADRLEQLWSFDAYGIPVLRGGRAFYTKKLGLQNQPVLYVADEDFGAPRPLVDPNALRDDGTLALTAWAPSPDGRWLAYALSEAGSDWRSVYVLNVDTGARLPHDELRWVKFSELTWLASSDGFFYGRYAEPPEGETYSDVNRQQRLYLHRVGTPQTADALVWERPEDPELSAYPKLSAKGDALALYLSRGTNPESAVAILPLGLDGLPSGPERELPGGFDAAHVPLSLDGRALWLLTDRDAPRQRVVRVDLDAPAPARWQTIVPETPDRIESARVVGAHVAVLRLRDAASALELVPLGGGPAREVALPGLGSAYGLTARPEDATDFVGFQSFTHPPSVYRLDLAAGSLELLFTPELDVDPDAFVVEQVFYPSADGTRVPMFVARHRDTPRQAASPTLLYGYGGFDISLAPSFKPSRLVWMEMGGVFAMANLRGGGEYGREWHEAGMKARKQNVFDDFIAAAEWLHAEGVSRPDRLAITGRSNGGLLVGATLVQRPDLFGAALPGVGVLDMLRFHKFTIGWAWAGEYGSADDPDDFRVLYAYSPVHNARPARYPATLVTTGDHDDRVVPSHSYKFAAALQAAQRGGEPVLIRVDTSAGHGMGKPVRKMIEEQADEWAFLLRALDFTLPATWPRQAPAPD